MNPSQHILDNFLSSLAETITWHISRSAAHHNKPILRSPELQPPDVGNDWPARVDYVRRKRQKLLVANRSSLGHAIDLCGGRLLVCDPAQSLSDGAAEVESNGFFDADNIPPWDLWVSYVQETPQRGPSWTRFDSYLLCWIPAAFAELVDRSILVNPEQCIQWASHVDATFIRHLRSAHLIF